MEELVTLRRRLLIRRLRNWPRIRLLRTPTCFPAAAVEEETWCRPEKTTKMAIIRCTINNFSYITTNLFMRAEKDSLRSHKLARLSTATSRHLRSLFRSQPLPLIRRGSGLHHRHRLRASQCMCTLLVFTMTSLSSVQMRVATIDVTLRCFTLFSFVSGARTPKRIN